MLLKYVSNRTIIFVGLFLVVIILMTKYPPPLNVGGNKRLISSTIKSVDNTWNDVFSIKSNIFANLWHQFKSIELHNPKVFV